MRLPASTRVRGLLRCLDAAFFVASFEEEGYYTLQDLHDDGQEAVTDFVQALSMPRGTDERFLKLAFQESEEEEEEAATDLVVAGPAAFGGPWDATWLRTVAPLYSLHMGCENMGPLLYSLVRFVKPSQSLEIGAGYTSAFLLQALEDNQRELCFWQEWNESSGPTNWLVRDTAPGSTASVAVAPAQPEEGACLHCIDNFAHEHSTAPLLWQVANRLKLQHRLRLHLDDARAFVEESGDLSFDFVWLDGLLDFAPPKKGDVAGGIDDFLALLWPRLVPGALVLLHSTLTNAAVRGWLDKIGERSPWGRAGAMLSLLEPHKKFQNSVTLLQFRPEGYAEPIYSKLP